MKKVIFALLSVVLLIGCNSSKYKIEGTTADAEMNGQTVFIKERINRVWVSTDSVKIENGGFVFEGVCDSARIAYIFCELPSGERIRQPFVFESGKINVSIDSLGMLSVNGTAQNDILQTYQSEKQKLYERADTIYKTLNDSTALPEAKNNAEMEIEKLNKEEVAIDIRYSTENVNTIAGSFIFESSFYGMSIQEKEAIIALMDQETKAKGRVAEIIEALQIEKKTAVGQQYTDIKLAGIAGESIALSSLVGKTEFVLIDFWASWCGPCMKSLPELKAFYDKYKGDKLEILGVSLDDDENAWKSTVEKQQLKWKHISDLKGWKCEGAKLYAVNAIPATVFIDSKGVILGRNLTIGQMELIILKTTK